MVDNMPSSLPEHTPPEYDLDGFHCPHSNCGVYSKQTWFLSATLHSTENRGAKTGSSGRHRGQFSTLPWLMTRKPLSSAVALC
jgi:hypothetical protein